jgi:hypothetical protein
MDKNPKYKVGDSVHFRLSKGDSHLSCAIIKEVINTRVDCGWGYMYRLNENGSLWIKENNIIT